jgi:hypothetical protein
MQKLDKEIHEFSPKKQDRYWATLERFADWLESLKASDPQTYQAIKNAPDAKARLTLIKTRRDLEWLKAQPKAVQQAYEKLDGDARAAFVVKLRQEEREKHETWLITKRFWNDVNDPKQTMPRRLSDFATISKDKSKTEVNRVKDYLENYLYLSAEEKALLEKAEGKWPDYPRTLVEIASKRPSALPTSRTVHKLADLPDPVRHRMIDIKKVPDKISKKALNELKSLEGIHFASKVVEIARRDKKYPFNFEFWACTEAAFLPPMQAFLKDQLMPKIKDNVADNRKLADALGKWPDYPLAIQELSKKHNLQPKWHYLPDAERWRWDDYKTPRYKSLTIDAGK